MKKLNREQVINEIDLQNGGNIDFHHFVYINNTTKSKFVCKIHKENGIFLKTPKQMRRGEGCKLCCNNRMALTKSKGVDYYINIHKENNKDLYTYPKEQTLYNSERKLIVNCHVHGNFTPSLSNLLSVNCGCRQCFESKGGYYSKEYFIKNPKDKDLKAILYLIKVYDNDESFYKIGITKRTVYDRFKNKTLMPYNYDIVYEFETNLYNAFIMENKLKDLYFKQKYIPNKDFGGMYECINDDSELSTFYNFLKVNYVNKK